ncbi:hypothetical protein KIW84_012290 [Lathyrus oleraceus]|uniref:Uncharacterized protein n=1 Tax=Pisum sativum TaxID=3888 RepID=A0A9D5BH76_PEA|nr:hypothetical protein KIW84_012290 [Pisum sativum]
MIILEETTRAKKEATIIDNFTFLASQDDFSVGQDYQVIPLADLEGVLDPQPEFLDALLWEPEYDIVSDDNDSEYNVKEGITLDSSVQLISQSTNHSLLNRLVSFNTAVCFAMMDIRNFMQFYIVDLKNEQVEKNV